MVLWIQTIFIKTSHFKQSKRSLIYKSAVLSQFHRTKTVFLDGRSEIFSLPHRELLEIHLIRGFICCMWDKRKPNPHWKPCQFTGMWLNKILTHLNSSINIFFFVKGSTISFLKQMFYFSNSCFYSSSLSTLSAYHLYCKSCGDDFYFSTVIFLYDSCSTLTSFSGLLQEIEQDSGCLVHTQLLRVLAAGLCQGTNGKHTLPERVMENSWLLL